MKVVQKSSLIFQENEPPSPKSEGPNKCRRRFFFLILCSSLEVSRRFDHVNFF